MSEGYHKVEWYQCDNCNYSTNDIDRICVHVCSEKEKPKVIILDNNEISIMKYAEEYPENWKRICDGLDAKGDKSE